MVEGGERYPKFPSFFFLEEFYTSRKPDVVTKKYDWPESQPRGQGGGTANNVLYK